MAAVLAAVDGLDEAGAQTVRQLVDIIFGGFTAGRQRSVSRVVRNLQVLGLVHTGYRMTGHETSFHLSDPHSDPLSTPDDGGRDRRKLFPALFVWSVELHPSKRADELAKQPAVDEHPEDRPVGGLARDGLAGDGLAGDGAAGDGAGWSIAADQQDLESWTFRRHRTDPNPRWCTPTEAGRILGVTAEHARKLATHYGVFSPWIAAGGRVLLRRSDVLTAAGLAGERGTAGRWAAAQSAVAPKWADRR